MKSMTGYGEASSQSKWTKVVVQVRTLNHRHLDIQIRGPREYLSIEEGIRKIIRQKISRGRVDVFMIRSPVKGQGRKLEMDEGLITQYLQSLHRVKKKFGLKGEIDISLFFNFPELFHLQDKEVNRGDERALVLRALNSALEKLEGSRKREGDHLNLDVQSQIRCLRKICAGLASEARKLRPQLRNSQVVKNGRNSAETPRETPEISNWTPKGDIHEETVRLRSHLVEMTRLVHRRGPMGKRVEFFLQELQRELNTISSKVPFLSVVQLVLAGKEAVEKIREQVQNLE
ncbi:MAG: YicC/YloC family endoribonuclease [Candidatus Binatia bacterium]